MPKLADIDIDTQRFKRRGLRPWSDFITHADKKSLKETHPKTTQDKVKTKSRQSQDKLETNLRQSQDKLETSLKQTQDKVKTQLKTKRETKSKQSQNKVKTNLSQIAFSSLVGIQREITLFLYENSKLSRDKKTSKLSIEHIAKSCEIGIKSIPKTIQRLEKKGILSRINFKNGRGGWSIYELAQNIFQEILYFETRDKLKTNSRQTQDKVKTQLKTQLKTNLLSSSSNIINKTTTTEELDLPEEWNNIKYGLIKNIGFSMPQLKQLYDTKICDSKIIQDSINHFAFALENNERIKSHNNPLNLFMGVLRKGHAWVESNYESPQDRALRELLKRKKAEKEKREERIKELYNLSFEEWRNSFSERELADLYKKICPKGGIKYRDKNNPLNRATFSNHFEANIWPEKRKELGLDELTKNE